MSALERLQSILSNRSSILEDREENENDIMTELLRLVYYWRRGAKYYYTVSS